MKKFVIEYQGFLLHFCTHTNEFNCVFGSKQLRQYAALSGAMTLLEAEPAKNVCPAGVFFLNIEVADPSCKRGEILEENSNIFFSHKSANIK